MDVLEYWSPTLDWSGFKQGALGDRAWSLFRQIVELSHAHVHWAEAMREIRVTRPPRPIYPNESKYQRKKRQDEWKRDVQRRGPHA